MSSLPLVIHRFVDSTSNLLTFKKSFPFPRTPSATTLRDLPQFRSVQSGTSTPQPLQYRMSRVSTLSRRIHGWSWQAFPIGMGTGAVYVCLSDITEEPGKALNIVQMVFFFLNIVLFLLNTLTLLLQLAWYPRHARKLVTEPAKGIYVPLVALSFATIIIGTINFSIRTAHISNTFIYCLFWIYVAFSVLVCFPMLMIWFNKPHDLKKFTPTWAFLIFPMMLVGIVAYNVLKIMDPADSHTLGVLLTAYIFQGLGFFMTFFYICIYILRIITTGFLDGPQANSAFVACGPPGFTAIALINLGEQSRDILSAQNLLPNNAGDMWYAAGVLASLLLFGLAVFFFVFGALPYWFKLRKHLSDILGCWALTFPNVGWILTLRKLGDIFNVKFLQVWHIIMVIAMCLTWIILFVLTAVAFWKGKIFMASHEEIMRDTPRDALDIELALFQNYRVAVAFGLDAGEERVVDDSVRVQSVQSA